MTRTFQASALAAFAMLGFSLVPASAGVVFSESFESPVVTGFDDNTVPSGGNWIGATQGYGATNRGLYNETFAWPATAAFSTAYGSQAYYLNYSNSGLTTAVGATGQTLTAGVTYKVTFNSAVTVGTASGSYRVELVAFGAADSNTARANAQTLPGTILATATGTVTTTDMSAAGSLTFTPDGANAHLGKDLGIRLIKATNSVLYDNIRLVTGHDMNPSPASGVYLPAGNTVLSWTNMPPTPPASSTPVDVWFGTNPASLTKVVSGVISSTNVNAPGAGTYYWRVDSHLDGNPNGTPVTGDLFFFVVTDSDGDGLPDAYELAHTSPPSGTALNPASDLDSDGLTAAQEYYYGTDPQNPDTDGDTLKDGDEIHGTAGLRPATNPLLVDTDGDGLSDGVETNTGIWVSATNTGTNPVDNDWDKDGLLDGAETNTGTLVDKDHAGTNPYVSDTDNDGVGDYYEVEASLTNPFDPNDKPKVPYPLPVPDGSTGVTNKPVRVYIMSGQSNMVGMGTVSGTADGSLETITRRQNKFPNLVDGTGAWRSRQDVRYRGVISAIGNGPLAPGFGASSDKIGPELGFGCIMGWYHDEPVLLLKSSIGNRSLGWDVLPPGSPSYQYGSNNYAGYGVGDQTWAIGDTPVPWTTGNWYAGYEWDRYFTDESEWAHPHAAETNVVDVLDNFAAQYPAWAGQGFEIAGFVWWQGDKDRYDMGYATKYEPNLVNLINSLRNYYTNRYPGKVVTNAPFVLATLGQTAIGDTSSAADKAILDAQLAVDGNSGKYPQYVGNVKTVYAHPLSQGGASNSHYNLNAETYMLVGDALGRAMLDLEDAAAGPDVTPPSPNPMTFAIAPTTVNTTTVGMVATTAIDASGPVQYYFENTSNSTNSGWITSTRWDSTGLTNGVSQNFRVKARDSMGNETAFSAVLSATPGNDTIKPSPDPMTFAGPLTVLGENSIAMTATTASDINGVQYQFVCTVGGGPTSAWQSSPNFTASGLNPATSYTYVVRAKDSVGNTTADSAPASATTAAPDSTPPAPSPMTFTSAPVALGLDSITMTASTASDVSGVEYFFDCTTAGGHDSGWQNSPSYTDGGLSPGTQYTYRVQARDKSPAQNATTYSATASATTKTPDLTPPSVLSLSPADNAIDVPVANNLVITFDEEISSDTGFITLKNLSDATETLIDINDGSQVTTTGSDLVINPTTNLLPGKNYAVRIDASALQDLAGNPFAGISDDTTWNFASAVVPFVWTQTTGNAQSWETGTNWLAGSFPVPVSGDTVDFGSVNILANTTLTLGADRTAQLWKFGDTSGSQTWSVAAGNKIILAGTTPTIQVNNATTTLDNIVDGTAGLIKTGGGALSLTNTANTYSGGTTINGGSLSISGNGCLGPDGSTVTFNVSSTFNPAAGYTLNKNFTLNNGAIVSFATANSNTTISGAVTGTGGVIPKTGSGSLTLTSTANTFTGPVTLGGGIFGTTITVNSFADSATPGTGKIYLGNQVSGASQYGAGTFIWHTGAVSALTLTNRQFDLGADGGSGSILNNNATAANTVTINSDLLSTIAGNKLLRLGGTNTGSNTFAGKIINGGGTVSLNKEGAGTWIVSGANTYTGKTTILQGVLRANTLKDYGMDSALGAPVSGAIQIGDGNNTGTLTYIGTGDTTNRSVQLGNTTAANTGGGTLNNNGSGALSFSAANFNSTITGITASRTLTLGGTYSGAANQIQGIIQDSVASTGKIAVTKAADASTWILTGTNTYTGATTVSGGTLLVNSPGSLDAGSAVAVNGTSTLGGNGSIGGTVTVAATASLAPGASAGTLAIGGGLNISALANNGAGKLNFELAAIGASDKVTVGGTLTIGTAFLGFSDFTFTALPGLQNGTYTLITYNTLSGTLAASGLSGSIGGGTGTLQLNTLDKTIELVVSGISGGAPEIAVEQPAATNIASGGSQGFGTVTLGSNTSLQFTIRNTGSAALNLTGTPLVAVSGTNAADFTVTAVPTTPVAISGGTTTFTVRFAPGGAGVRGAVLTISNNDSDEGTFTINVSGSGQTAYDAWSGGAAFDTDANGDGVKNGVAWLLGAAGPNAPVTLPVAAQSSGNLVLSFDCLSATNRGGAVLNLQYSRDLGISDAWSGHTVAVPGAVGNSTVSGVNFTATANGALIHIVAEVPASAASSGGKLFGRLNAETTP